MSCYFIQYVQGAKMMRPVQSKEEYLKLRDSDRQKWLVSEIRKGKKDGSKSKEEIDKMKRQLIQFNYSCIPGEDGHLKGVKTPSMSFGMDIDFDPEDPDYEKKMAEVPRVVMEKKDELGLLMMERSVGKGYHLVCKRTIFDGIAEGKILENQEMNLRRTSEIIGCAFDKGARDVTRVFFGTTASEEDLLFIDEGLFEAEKAEGQAAKLPGTVAAPQGAAVVAASAQGAAAVAALQGAAAVEASQGIPYSDSIKKYWELN